MGSKKMFKDEGQKEWLVPVATKVLRDQKAKFERICIKMGTKPSKELRKFVIGFIDENKHLLPAELT